MDELDDLIEKLTNDFKKKNNISEEYIILAFKKYLKHFVKNKEYFSPDEVENIKRQLIFSSNYINSLQNVYFIKSELIYDKNLEIIRESSMKIFNEAIRVLNGIGITQNIIVDEELRKIREAFKSVEIFNKEVANSLYSEAILDMNYINYPNTNIISLRLGREYRRLKNKRSEL